MPKRVTAQELDRFVALLARHKSGLGIHDLEQAAKGAGLDLDRRTLQRRVARLIQARRVFKAGKGRASRYLLAPITAAAHLTEAPDVLVAAAEVYVPLSRESQELKALVRRPIAERKPVGYNRAFLERYEPNSSAYVPDSVRSLLHRLGRSPAMQRSAGTYARDVLGRLMIDLSWASSRLEGNTYSRLETQNLIEFGHAADGKDQREAQMILNHKAAIEMLVDHAEEISFDAFTFFNLHALLSENLLMDPGASGRLRTATIEISGSVFLPLAVPQQIEEYFRLILDKANVIRDPFEQAFFLMVQIPYLQPFLDVNKRVSRLGANIPLIKHNLSPLSFVDVPEPAYVDGILGVYELNRVELLRDAFVWAYERSCQRYVAIKESLPEPDPVRLRNREALIHVVGNIVRGGKPIDTRLVRELAAPLVKLGDLAEFVAMAFNDLHHLHEGNIARYRLRLPEFRAWKRR
ncbi:MAG: Fic family protein [Betaproteobacteria bacterium]|nr:Fic family protein [Betaproteobacteria bacterium]